MSVHVLLPAPLWRSELLTLSLQQSPVPLWRNLGSAAWIHCHVMLASTQRSRPLVVGQNVDRDL